MGPQYGPLCGPHPSLACDQKSTVPPHQPPPGYHALQASQGTGIPTSPVCPLLWVYLLWSPYTPSRPPTTVGTPRPAVCLPTGYDAPALWRLLPARPGAVNQLWLGQPSRSVQSCGLQSHHLQWGLIHSLQGEVSQFSHSVMSDSLQPRWLQHARLPCPSPTQGLAQTHVHQLGDAIQPSHPLSSPSPPVINLSQHQGLFQLVSSSYQMAKVLEISASASVLPMNIQDWFLLGWTGWISLQSKRLSRVFSNTTVQRHQFFSAQLFL